MVICTPETDTPETEEKAAKEDRQKDLICLSWDIETGPLPDGQLRQMMPEFVPPPTPGDFDESSVKLGNLKDAAKIREKIESARKAHKAAVVSHCHTVESAAMQHFLDFRSKAALSSTTGQVVAIGCAWIYCDYDDKDCAAIYGQAKDATERQVISAFWMVALDCMAKSVPMVGHNIHGFDLPFLVQRSWVLGAAMPGGILQGTGRKYWNSLFIDTMKEWSFGDPRGHIKLDTLAKLFGYEGKMDGECCGANFHEFWFSDDGEKHQQAIDYLTRDIELPASIAMTMGVV